MKRFSTSRRVAHGASDMFALVADVERYPEFVPLCQALRIRKRQPIDIKGREDGEGRSGELLIADMTVAYKVLRETFTSEVRLDPGANRIDVRYVDGPFQSLDNVWRFTPQPSGGSVVDFSIAYAFRSRTFQVVAGAVFDRAFQRFAEAFEARADRIYGRAA